MNWDDVGDWAVLTVCSVLLAGLFGFLALGLV